MDLLSNILSQLRLTGTLYFRTSFKSPWGVRVPAFENVARFHFAYRGRCLVQLESQKKPVVLEQGDLIIITRGAAHTLHCDALTNEESLPLDVVIAESGFTGKGTLVYGDSNNQHDTQLICGHFAFDKKIQHPLINALPSFIHINNYGMEAGRWLDSTLNVVGAEAGRDLPGCDLITLKMSEIIFVQTLRAYLQKEGANQPVLAAFADIRISRALEAIHENPENPWTLESLAKIAGLSRTAFTQTFTRYLNTTPLVYMTDWRMQIARQLLIESGASIIHIAERTGYQSEAAFSRVFKRYYHLAPASYRRSLLAVSQ